LSSITITLEKDQNIKPLIADLEKLGIEKLLLKHGGGDLSYHFRSRIRLKDHPSYTPGLELRSDIVASPLRGDC
jgi:hypothetical protein